MNTSMKWLWTFVILFIFIAFVTIYAITQNSAVRTTSEVETLVETISVGLVRAEIENEENLAYFDKEELVAYLISSVSEVQKNHKYDIKLQYKFLDEEGKQTEEENKIRGLQFAVSYIDSKGEVVAHAQKRLALNILKTE